MSVKVAYSPWLHAEGGCPRRQGEFTRLTVNEPGVYRISSEYIAAVTDAEPSSPPLLAASGDRRCGTPPQAAGRISPDS